MVGRLSNVRPLDLETSTGEAGDCMIEILVKGDYKIKLIERAKNIKL